MTTALARYKTPAAHAFSGVVAAPMLVWAGVRYPGSWKSKLLLAGTGVALGVISYRLLISDEPRSGKS